MQVRAAVVPFVFTAILAACGGGSAGSGSAPVPAVVPAMVNATGTPIALHSTAPSGTSAPTHAAGATPTPIGSSIATAAGATPPPIVAGATSPTPFASASVASLGPTAVPAIAPTTVPPVASLALATGNPIGINVLSIDPAVIGTDALFPNSAVNTAPASSQAFHAIDGIPAEYSITGSGRHFHWHLTLLDAAGKRVIVPLGIGMLGDPNFSGGLLIPFQNYPLTTATEGGTTGTYFLHTHDHTGMIHDEDDSGLDAKYGLHVPAVYTLGNLLHLWGETADHTHFTRYMPGQIHIYISQIYVVHPANAGDASTETQTAPVEWRGDPLHIPAIAADDFAAIPLHSFEEITVESSAQYYPVPRYYFPSYWCRGNEAAAGTPDCRLETAPGTAML